ncbi:hypothetical protein [Komagataeibacter oboediens]|uniref:hypothetical protein n=1 Tax=Komagataeibacter oboediens TaxID=65958 RepID=UPI0011B5D9A5|nr:hypothetical protein [Komagataeibacter oboediens]
MKRAAMAATTICLLPLHFALATPMTGDFSGENEEVSKARSFFDGLDQSVKAVSLAPSGAQAGVFQGEITTVLNAHKFFDANKIPILPECTDRITKMAFQSAMSNAYPGYKSRYDINDRYVDLSGSTTCRVWFDYPKERQKITGADGNVIRFGFVEINNSIYFMINAPDPHGPDMDCPDRPYRICNAPYPRDPKRPTLSVGTDPDTGDVMKFVEQPK